MGWITANTTALATTALIYLSAPVAIAQTVEAISPCLDPALAASHDALIAAFKSEGWQDGKTEATNKGAWFKAATLDPPKKFWTPRAADIWKRDVAAWFEDYRLGYVVLSKGDLTLVLKGQDAPLGRGPAHCMLIADDLDGQDHETEPKSVDKSNVATYFWSMREIDMPETFSLLELRFSTLELVEGERFEMLDLYMRPTE